MVKRRLHPMAEHLRWLEASNHRTELFWTVVNANALGKRPSQAKAMDDAPRDYWARSHRSNGSQAIRDMIDRGFLFNANLKKGEAQLEVGWALIGVISDWQEEEGLPRLDVSIKGLDMGKAIWRSVPDIFEDIDIS